MLGAALGMAGIGLLGWGLWPAERVTKALTVDLDPVRGTQYNAGNDALHLSSPEPPQGTLILEYPGQVKAGDSALVRLRIVPKKIAFAGGLSEESEVMQAQPLPLDPGAALPLLIQTRLELVGATVSPEGDLTSPWSTEAGVGFAWAVGELTGASAQGTAWTFQIPAGSAVLTGDRMAISAQPVEMKNTSLLGVSGPAARASGTIATVFAAILSLPRADLWLRRLKVTRRDQRVK
jgi:hypothetical protein